jgi:hypothetical protein
MKLDARLIHTIPVLQTELYKGKKVLLPGTLTTSNQVMLIQRSMTNFKDGYKQSMPVTRLKNKNNKK